MEAQKLISFSWGKSSKEEDTQYSISEWKMKEISEWLGHSDISTTMNIYSHIDMEHKRELGNTLNGLFG